MKPSTSSTPPEAEPLNTEGYARVRPPGAAKQEAEKASRPKQVLVEAKPLLERPSPPEDKGMPCPQCGGDLAYAPGDDALSCRFCGYKHTIPTSQDDVRELDFEKYFQQGQTTEAVMEGVENEVRCTGCGATTMVPANVATEYCPFCAGNLENALTTPEPIMAPSGVLPFQITRPQARGAFKLWTKSRWFAPNDFKHLDDFDRLNGLYLPHWTYDAMTFSVYSGQRGDYYYTWTGTGKNRRRVRRTRWRRVSGRLDHWFDDVLVCASTTLPQTLTTKLSPWDLKKVRPYKPAYLTGFRSERYRLAATDGYYQAREIMDDEINQLIRKRIGGDTQRVDSVFTDVNGVRFKLILLPVWLSAYRYDKKTYRVAINAQTGEVVGERPWSWIKIALASIAALVVVSLIVLAAMHGGA